jgi:hypothetical protein
VHPGSLFFLYNGVHKLECTLVVCSFYTIAKDSVQLVIKLHNGYLKKAMVIWTLGMKNKQTVSLLKDLSLKKPLKQVTMKVKVMCNVQQVTGDHTVNLKEILNVSLIL